MGKTEFRPDRAGLAALMVSAPMRAAMTGAGREVAAQAARTAPRRTGGLAASFRVEPTTTTVVTRRGGTQRRASGRVVTDLDYAAATEFGHNQGAGTQAAQVAGRHVLGTIARTRAARAARRSR